MFKTLRKAQKGFTIIELLIVIAIIAILALLVLNNFQGAQAKARDQQRTTDINNIHGKLEEFYNENSFYPASLNVNEDAGIDAEDFPGIDGGSFIDPSGTTISVATAVADADALSGDAPANNGYQYTAFGCTDDECTGYQLKTYIERPANEGDNPYIKLGLNNN